MDNKSVTSAEADPTKDMDEKKISDVMEILQGLSDRLKTIQENMDCRLQKMEERMDLLISSISEKGQITCLSMNPLLARNLMKGIVMTVLVVFQMVLVRSVMIGFYLVLVVVRRP
ncbi:unnamed protein product, partial [Brassica rapa subsp. narinosa]